MQQFFSLLSWRLFTAQHGSGVFPPIIEKLLHQVGDLFELNVKLRCQKVDISVYNWPYIKLQFISSRYWSIPLPRHQQLCRKFKQYSKLNPVFSQFALIALSGPYVKPVKSCDSLLCTYCNPFHLVQSFFIPGEEMSSKQQPNL